MIVKTSDQALNAMAENFIESLKPKPVEPAVAEPTTEGVSPELPPEGPLHAEWRVKAEEFKRQFPGSGEEFETLMTLSIGEEPEYAL